MSFLTVESLAKNFGIHTVFHDASFSLEAGECLLIKGTNGSGKSTLLSCVAGFLQPDEGTIKVSGFNVWKSSGFNQIRSEFGIAILPQQNLLYSSLSVEENLLLFATLASNSSRQVEQLIEELELGQYRNHLVKNCSQGISRRVGLGRALLASRKFILLDEPFANLDEAAVGIVAKILKRLRDDGACLLLTSHQSEVASSIATKVLGISSGRVKLSTSEGELMQ